MNPSSVTPGRPATRAPVFFWITVGLLAILLLGGAAAALLLALEARNINRSGGWGWLLAAGLYVVAITVVCCACALATAVSLFRRESHRRLSIAILIISSLIVSALGPNVIRVVIGLRRQHDEATRRPAGTPRPPADPPPRATIPSTANKGSSAPAIRDVENPQVLELKSKFWEAIRATNAAAFVDCFYVEERFNTPEIREENRNQIEILLRGETIDVEIREIPAQEMVEIMKIQNAKTASRVRYSLVPRMMLRIRQEVRNVGVGRNFLIGEQDGKWYIITMAGHTT